MKPKKRPAYTRNTVESLTKYITRVTNDQNAIHNQNQLRTGALDERVTNIGERVTNLGKRVEELETDVVKMAVENHRRISKLEQASKPKIPGFATLYNNACPEGRHYETVDKAVRQGTQDGGSFQVKWDD